jgi:hypothetical protein
VAVWPFVVVMIVSGMPSDTSNVKALVEGGGERKVVLHEVVEPGPWASELAYAGTHLQPFGATKVDWPRSPKRPDLIWSYSIPTAHGGVPASQLVIGGLTGAVLGTGVGFGVSWLAYRDRFDVEAVGYGLITVASAQALGLALGVHLADEGDGSFWVRAGTSLGLAAAGLILSAQAWGPAFALVPPLQLYSLAGLRIGNRL